MDADMESIRKYLNSQLAPEYELEIDVIPNLLRRRATRPDGLCSSIFEAKLLSDLVHKHSCQSPASSGSRDISNSGSGPNPDRDR